MKIESAELFRSAHEAQDFVRDGLPQVAFVGRSNVGKSSLLNRLLGRRDLARTSSTPGRTRAVHYYRVNRRYYFVDLPGYGFARVGRRERERWAELIDEYFRSAPEMTQAVLIADAKLGGLPVDREAFDYLTGFGIPVVVAATKIDRVPRTRRPKSLETLRGRLAERGSAEIVAVSARTGEGLAELWRQMRFYLEGPQDRSTT